MTFFLIAGETSGDQLGAALMAGMRQLRPDVAFTGIGGPQMMAQGMDSLFPMDELSLMGIWEVLPKFRHLKRRIAQAAEAVIAAAPEALITIDSPDFCLRVARAVRAARPDLRTIHYVAPSVWAWRPGRALKMAEVIDHVLAILPFEPPLMRALAAQGGLGGCLIAAFDRFFDFTQIGADARPARLVDGIARFVLAGAFFGLG